MFIMMAWYKMFLEHPQSTNNPQGYWCHGFFSVINSLKGMWFMLLGIIHGILPIVFTFSTSSFIIKSFVKLVQAERHQEEMKKYIDSDTLAKINKQITYEFISKPDRKDWTTGIDFQ